jgi:hypothetical protein
MGKPLSNQVSLPVKNSLSPEGKEGFGFIPKPDS